MSVVKRIYRRFSGLDVLSWDAATYFLKTVAACHQEGTSASVFLAGGSTPRVFYETLAGEPFNRMIPWQSVHLFWGDERFVPHESDDSNYRMANESLLYAIDIPDRNIHPIGIAYSNHETAALAYENELKRFFSDHTELPQIDLTILGIGADGHTASLFPGDPVLQESDRWVMAVNAPAYMTPVPRITLTLPVLNNSRNILVVAARPGKEQLIDNIEYICQNNPEMPIAMLNPREELRCYIAQTL